MMAEWGRSLGISFAIKTSLAGEVIARALADYRTTHVGLSFDPSLITAIGRDCRREWDAVRPLVRHVHLSDRTLDAESVALGRGDVPMTKLIERFIADGYQGAFVLKSSAGHDGRAALTRDLSYLHRQLSQASAPLREAA
jgi:sugar phosphate isomerase/epimerase